MKPERRYVEFLQDIANNLEKAESFVHGMDYDDFLADKKTRYSVICALEIVGEAAKKVPGFSQTTESSCALEGYGRNERSADPWILRDRQ